VIGDESVASTDYADDTDDTDGLPQGRRDAEKTFFCLRERRPQTKRALILLISFCTRYAITTYAVFRSFFAPLREASLRMTENNWNEG
jgi:hypothetical protein